MFFDSFRRSWYLLDQILKSWKFVPRDMGTRPYYVLQFTVILIFYCDFHFTEITNLLRFTFLSDYWKLLELSPSTEITEI